MLAVLDVPCEQTRHFGVVSGHQQSFRLSQVTEMIEKSQPKKVPSTLAVTFPVMAGPRYVKLLAQEQVACRRRIGNAYTRLHELVDLRLGSSMYFDKALKHLKVCCLT